MKKEILTLIIGILIGAILATGIFLVLQNNSGNSGRMEERNGQGQMGDPPDGNMIPGGRSMDMTQKENQDSETLES